MAILQFIEMILGRVNGLKRYKTVRKEKISESEASRPVEIHPDFFYKQRNKPDSWHQHSGENIEVVDNFEEFLNAVEEINSELTENGSAFRISASNLDGEIFFSILKIKNTGEITEINKRNITHDNYFEWIKHIEKGEGFFIDESE